MREIYNELWKLAKPYYEKGRPMDIDHVTWLMKQAEYVCEKENIDESILMPLAILHDVGYAETGPAYFEKELKKDHMEAGKKIARKLLKSVDYPEDKIEEIEYYISVHDNWLFGDHSVFKKNKILAVFNDLDYMWMSVPKGFTAVRKVLEKNKKEMLEFIKNTEKHKKMNFATETTRELYKKYLSKLEKEVN